MEIGRMGDLEVIKNIYVVLDTNFLFMHLRKFDVFEEISSLINYKPEFICLESVLNELEKLERKNRKNDNEIKKRIGLIKEKCELQKSNYFSADKDILEIALNLTEKGIVIVATNDRELRRKLRQIGIKSIYYRESENSLETDFEFWL
ncbi:PIN domain-containing protein [Fervidicoccus fontis]|nr:PIN domain-containing protein [Fervidicoccus fontis]HEW63542.1 hypothetical protein [Fervidicoccus fontis]